LLSTLTMGGLAAVFALFLSIAHKKLKVEEDPRVEQILGHLPGVNCGACGRASCRSLAEAIVKGEALASACVAGGNEVGQKIAALMGVESGSTQSKVAVLYCGALQSERGKKAEYEGVKNPDSYSSRAYGKTLVYERHRHRYEFNNEYRSLFGQRGLRIAGVFRQKDLVEIIEISDHPWFVAVQFHPEFQSHPQSPHPLFRDFVKAAMK